MTTPKAYEVYPVIYKRTTTGDIQEWHVERKENAYRSHTGKRGGKIVTAAWTTCEPKNVGKSNEINGVQQAHNEVLAKYTKKLRQDFKNTIEEIDTASRFKPMLADKFGAREDKIPDEEIIYFQPKLDGFRCVANASGLWTRDGLPILTAPHVVRSLAPLFSRHANLTLDGELYNHDLHDDFNTISSVLRKKTPSTADLLRSESLVQYHLYDMPDNDQPFIQRYTRLVDLVTEFVFKDTNNSTPLRLVETIAGTKNDAVSFLDKFQGEGYEGAIARRNLPYENKRSQTLLKVKKFLDDEFQIIRIEDGRGNRAGIAARAVLQLADGREFEAGMIGSHDYCRELYENREAMVGKMATIQYLNMTPGGVPRGGKMKTADRWA